MFLATAPTGVLTAGTAGLLRKANLWERCCTFMEKQRRCTIAGITVLFVYIVLIHHQELARCVANGAQAAVGDDACH